MHPVQRKIFASMTLAEKLRVANRLYWTARRLKTAAIRTQHPDWSDDEVHEAVRRSFLYART